ncbi:hypothetical protein G7Z17_g6274 [Cylindrodendrum hubeiense]|uniref:Integral membrane protein n=1 Tax=Cylindrodendrum hubeiense TaxID=595255 RepID=A0A9P5L8E7_9HYPO|nr:hypothetical protein G7Z17_g6274 [Cylindrodendrum hubeiense]
MASTTIVPFTNTALLPSCAAACGPLYDANGACVPPAVDAAVASWFRDICSVADDSDDTGDNNGDVSSTTTDSAGSTSTSKSGSSSGGGDWLSNHYQWVIMIVILVVGIAGIWIGACIWRRRYLRKRDRQRNLGQKHSGSASHPSWGPGVAEGEGSVAPHDPSYDSQRNSHAILTANTPAATPPLVQEKSAPKPKDKKRWVVKERT